MSTYESVARAFQRRLKEILVEGEAAEFAREIGLHKSEISRYRRNGPLPNPQLKRICRIADGLGLTPAELLSEQEEGYMSEGRLRAAESEPAFYAADAPPGEKVTSVTRESVTERFVQVLLYTRVGPGGFKGSTAEGRFPVLREHVTRPEVRAVRVEDEAFGRIRPGDVVLVDPFLEPEPEDVVLASVGYEDARLFRYRIKNGRPMLTSDNPKIADVLSGWRINGVVIGLVWQDRRHL